MTGSTSTYDSWDETPPPPRRGLRAVLSTALWTSASLGAFVAVIAWAYDLGARDPSDVPAFKDPLAQWKTEPTDAGGWRAENQDSAAYAPLGDSRALLDPSATLGPAPERPPESDLAAAARRAELRDQPPADPRANIDTPAFTAVMRSEAGRADPLKRRAAIDLDAQRPLTGGAGERLATRPDFPANLGPDSETPPDNAARFATGDASAAAGGEQVAALDAPPDAEPPAVEAASAPAAASSSAPVAAAPTSPPSQQELAAREQKAAAATVSRAEVQIGAFKSAAEVEKRWTDLQAQQQALLGGQQMRIEPVEIGGAKLYRLRVTGFADRAAASQLCGSLKAKGVDCYTVSR